MSLTPRDKARRVAAKRTNERLKVLVSTMNAIALTTIGATFILPSVGASAASPSLVWILSAAALHSMTYLVLSWWRSED